MKTLKKTVLVALLLFSTLFVQAQDEKEVQAYWIHEDRVKPSMVEEYEQVTKDLVAKCTEHNIQETKWLTVAQNDHTYLYVTPMEKFAEFDENQFATLGEKMGTEEMGKLFARFNPCYDVHGDYVVYLHKELSHMPGGINQNPEGQYYRKFFIDYVSPANQKGYMAGMKKIKELLAKNNAKLEYRVYRTGLGVMDSYFMIAFAAESGAAFEQIMDETWEATKDEFGPLITGLRKSISRSEEKSGWMRGDLGYAPKK